MSNAVNRRLRELGLVLPEAAAPVAAYVPCVEAGGLLHISGQLPFREGVLITGKLGQDVDFDTGRDAAKRCGLMLLAQIERYCGGFDRVKRIVRLGVYVNCTRDFVDQPKIANGASELMVELFEDAGKHARSAVGVPSLPLNAAVEIDGIVQLA